jgi:hypothetical protein
MFGGNSNSDPPSSALAIDESYSLEQTVQYWFPNARIVSVSKDHATAWYKTSPEKLDLMKVYSPAAKALWTNDKLFLEHFSAKGPVTAVPSCVALQFPAMYPNPASSGFTALMIEDVGFSLSDIQKWFANNSNGNKQPVAWNYLQTLNFVRGLFGTLKFFHSEEFDFGGIISADYIHLQHLDDPSEKTLKWSPELTSIPWSMHTRGELGKFLDIAAMGKFVWDLLTSPSSKTGITIQPESNREKVLTVLAPYTLELSNLTEEDYVIFDPDARKIEKILAAAKMIHERKLSYIGSLSKPTTRSPKSLFALSLQKLKENIHENINGYLSCWDNMLMSDIFPLIGFSRAAYIIQNGVPPIEFNTVEKMMDHHQKKELQYRRMFVQDRSNPIFERNPYLLLEDIFDANGEARIFKLAVSKEEAGSLFFVFKHNLDNVLDACDISSTSQSPLVTVTSLADFQRNWNELTHHLLRYVNFDNVFVAGGCILAALQPNFSVKMSTYRNHSDDSQFVGSDIDIFLYGLEAGQLEAKVVEIYEAIMKSVTGDLSYQADRESLKLVSEEQEEEHLDDVLIVRNVRTMTFVFPYPRRQIQIVFRAYKSPAEILMGSVSNPSIQTIERSCLILY